MVVFLERITMFAIDSSEKNNLHTILTLTWKLTHAHTNKKQFWSSSIFLAWVILMVFSRNSSFYKWYGNTFWVRLGNKFDQIVSHLCFSCLTTYAQFILMFTLFHAFLFYEHIFFFPCFPFLFPSFYCCRFRVFNVHH